MNLVKPLSRTSNPIGAKPTADQPTPVTAEGPLDKTDIDEVLASLRELPTKPRSAAVAQRVRYASVILRRLARESGQTWPQRWEQYEARHGGTWNDGMVEDLTRALRNTEPQPHDRSSFASSLSCLAQMRLLRLSYGFQRSFRSSSLYTDVRALRDPELFAKAMKLGQAEGMSPKNLTMAFRALSMIIVRTDKNLSELTDSDMLEFQAEAPILYRHSHQGLHSAWHLLVLLGQIRSGHSLESVTKPGQRSTAELIDRYSIKNTAIRDVLIRYLNERRPGVDYNTFTAWVSSLGKIFWLDIEKHHPGIGSLDLPEEVATAWKERLRFRTHRGAQVPRKGYFNELVRIRTFYLDMAEWALEDPSWAQWAVPCPIRRNETEGMGKAKKAHKAEMHQRIRERLPHLQRMVDAAQAWKDESQELAAAIQQASIDDVIEHRGERYRRTTSDEARHQRDAPSGPARLLAVNLDSGEPVDVGHQEDRGFWAWACVETLRHTGTRVEELLELTHLALVSYRLPDTGEVVPLLQIIPSKSNEERLLLVTPELASVLASIVHRLRQPDGTIPLVPRYDIHERTVGPKLPHLFQRQFGWKRRVISPATVGLLLDEVLRRTGITDRTGQPLNCTPHDFRRMFSTEAVTGGLPIHIAAKILGHANINTTEGYTAVFQDDLIRAYRTFIDRRRTHRPTDEYREPTAEEWIEFQQHFALRKVSLGDCGRPYGSDCIHEHACVRCPMLRVDPRAKGRLQEIIANLTERIEEAQHNGWLGEIEGLKTSQTAAIAKLASLNRAERNKPGITHLSPPAIRRS